MTKISPTPIEPTELYRALSYDEVLRLSRVINEYLIHWIRVDEAFREPGNIIEKQMWVTLPPHFIQVNIDFIVKADPFTLPNPVQGIHNYFSGPLYFYNDVNEFLLDQHLHTINLTNLN